jgi:hypothetical protein
VVSVAALLAFGFEHTATRAATLIIQYGAYLILAAYLMTVIAALAWTWRTRRRPLPLAILAVGAAVLGYVVYRTFTPFPPAPFGWVVLASIASAAAGALILLTPGLLPRMRQSRLLAVTAAAGTGSATRARLDSRATGGIPRTTGLFAAAVTGASARWAAVPRVMTTDYDRAGAGRFEVRSCAYNLSRTR